MTSLITPYLLEDLCMSCGVYTTGIFVPFLPATILAAFFMFTCFASQSKHSLYKSALISATITALSPSLPSSLTNFLKFNVVKLLPFLIVSAILSPSACTAIRRPFKSLTSLNFTPCFFNSSAFMANLVDFVLSSRTPLLNFISLAPNFLFVFRLNNIIFSPLYLIINCI